MYVKTEVTDSHQWRTMVNHPVHGRISLFDGATHYSLDAHEMAYRAHVEMGTDPVIQRREVRVTFEYGEWEDLPVESTDPQGDN